MEKRPQFGNRFLTEDQDVFEHNAWDNVEWDDEQEMAVKASVEENATVTLTDEEINKFDIDADKFWDSFYEIHQNRFFKDRHWLFTEFPELAPNVKAPERVYSDENLETENTSSENENETKESEKASEEKKENVLEERRIFEIGCGVGNTIIPILKYSQENRLKIYGCDFSSKAIEILKETPELSDSTRCEVFVMDASLENWTVPFEESSIDIITLIFVLSAIHPSRMKNVAENCFRYLKPGGLVLFRDYGRYDMAQLRFKKGKCLEENFYVRGDGTRVYFFEQDDIKKLFEYNGFIEEQNLVDRRLQVNRGRMLKMYRVWILAKFRKPMKAR